MRYVTVYGNDTNPIIDNTKNDKLYVEVNNLTSIIIIIGIVVNNFIG